MICAPVLPLLLLVSCSSSPAAVDAALEGGTVDTLDREAAVIDAPRPDAVTPSDVLRAEARQDGLPACPQFAAGVKSGTVASSLISEASGLIFSRKNPGVLWAHNDSGDTARMFALSAQGTHLGVYNFGGAQAVDWEDMASGPGPVAGAQYLYAGDIGDNGQARANIAVYRVQEPAVSATQSPVTVTLQGVEKLAFVYPDGPQNAETLLVDPQNGDLYIVSKASSGASKVYLSASPQDPAATRTFTKVTTLQFGTGSLAHTGALTTGGDVSPDGTEVIVRGYSGAALWRRAPGAPLWQAFASAPCQVPLATEPQGETVSFDAQGKGYYTLSEGTSQPIYFFGRK